jgi:hypothetical protein
LFSVQAPGSSVQPTPVKSTPVKSTPVKSSVAVAVAAEADMADIAAMATASVARRRDIQFSHGVAKNCIHRTEIRGKRPRLRRGMWRLHAASDAEVARP